MLIKGFFSLQVTGKLFKFSAIGIEPNDPVSVTD